jgi:hypothetical protein
MIFKTVTITWLLTAVIFTNFYAGIMIGDLTAPLPSDILHSFDEILDAGKKPGNEASCRGRDYQDFWSSNYTNSSNPSTHLRLLACNPDLDPEMGYHSYHEQFRTKGAFTVLQRAENYCRRSADSLWLNSDQQKIRSSPWTYSLFLQLKVYLVADTDHFEPKYWDRISDFLSSRNRHYPKDPEFPSPGVETIPNYLDAAFENELVSCGRSSKLSKEEPLYW